MTTPLQVEVWHRNYNPDKQHNLPEIPAAEAVYGIFSIIKGKPANCRFAGAAEDLRSSVQSLFEQPEEEGLKKFMQGPWVKLLMYTPMPGADRETLNAAAAQWIQQYKPAVDEEGEYPGYYACR